LLVGGSCLGNPLSPEPGQLWEYRIDANQWSRRADLPLSISDHSAVTARDYVWVFGGTDPEGDSNQVYRYDLLTDRWSLVAVDGDRPDPRSSHRAVALGNAMVVFGGIEQGIVPETVDDVWQLDLDTLSWTEKSPMPSRLAQMTVDTIPPSLRSSLREQVLIYGGMVDAWSFPYDLSDNSLIYTSDQRVPSASSPLQARSESER
jgi:hypothetical protein